MKILEPQSAILTNYEVYTLISDQHNRYEAQGKRRRRGPGNLETLGKEMMKYFHLPESPLASQPFPYSDTTIRTLLERLRPYELTKAEIIMIMNLRPLDLPTLSAIVEELEARVPEEADRREMFDIIGEVLGSPHSLLEKTATENAKSTQLKGREIEKADAGGHLTDEMLIDET